MTREHGSRSLPQTPPARLKKVEACGAKPCNRPLRLRRHGAMFLAFVALSLGAPALSKLDAVDAHVRPWVLNLSYRLASLSSSLPFSLSEVLIGSALGVGGVFALRGAWQVFRRRRAPGNAAVCGALWTTSAVCGWLTLITLTWGLGLPPRPLYERLGWLTPDDGSVMGLDDPLALAALAAEYVDASNAAYRLAFRTDDLGRPSRPASLSTLDAEIDAGFARAVTLLGLPDVTGRARGRAKPIYASEVLSRFLALGYFDPLTGEANYNRYIPGATLPHTIAHEKAHQRGTLREDEANFLGFVACAASDDPYVRYSGYLHAQRVLLVRLSVYDPAAARALATRRLPGVTRDVHAQRDFLMRYSGLVALASEAVWDTGIKLSGDRDGLDAYGRSALLIEAFARHHGSGTVVREPLLESGPAEAPATA